MKPASFAFWTVCVVAFGLSTATLPAQDLLRISEFAAVNDGPLLDEDGDKSDWVEIHNPGTNAVNLDGWFLTDSAGNLNKWRFPATNLPPNGYLVVFASNKNRRTAGAPLHTNFRLDADGEYLGLIKPDGATVASEYAPTYLPQVGRVSFGIPAQQTAVNLVSAGAGARVLIPGNDALGYSWTTNLFDDSGWTAAQTGVGFETDGQTAFVSARIADSVTEFSGAQGVSNWFYGYWDKAADANGAYSDADFLPFPNAGGAFSETNFWDGAAWTWFGSNAPNTQLTSEGGRTSGNNGIAGVPDHAVVRRYLSEYSGPITISGRLTHTNRSSASQWVRVTATGVAANSLLYVYLTAAGDGYIDDMQLVAGSVAETGPNLLPNGDFESGALTPWTIGTDNNLSGSSVTTAVKRSGNYSLRMVASVGGTTQASSIWQTIAPALVVGSTYTLSFWYLPGTTPSPLTTRFSGNWINTTFTPPACGDGVLGRIFVDGAEVYSKTVFLGSADYAVKARANLGSHIDFVLDAGAANNDQCDQSLFTAKVDTEDPNIVVVADSAADWSFSGTQGERNWFYGYYNKTADTVAGYQSTNFAIFPRGDGPHGVANYWTGAMWDWYAGNPPWDEIGQTTAHPNGATSTGGEHWVIRRWVSEVNGRITVDWTLAKQNTAGGNGVTGRIFRNGVQMDAATITGTDGIGVSRTTVITNVQAGDFIDIALDPTGTDSLSNDSSDGSLMTVVIRGTPSLSSAVASDLAAVMKGINSTAYLRIPFVVTNSAPINYLTLRMKYDDGFVAYLNGVAVAARNSPAFPDAPAWNSAATGSRPDSDAIQFEDFDLTPVAGLVQQGTNVLAIHGLNLNADDGDFLLLPELSGVSVTGNPTNHLYFAVPTPGAPNGLGSTNLGPLLVNVKHAPNEPADNENLYVTAELVQTFNAISNVTLTYRVMFSNEVTVPMFDDGLHADGIAGDGVWGGTVPASAANPGQMIRYYVFTRDINANTTRFPAFLNATNSPQYHGTVVRDPSLTNSLPVFHWFIQTPTAADNATGTKCSIFYLGRFYDNCGINLHGQSSSGFPKKSYDVDMNPDYGFVWKEGEKTVDDINLLSTWADKSHLRNMLAYDGYKEAGAGYHWVYAIRVQQNGAFFSVANLMENGDENYLDRLGLDPAGALYKMYNQFNSAASTTLGINANAEKKTRKNEGNADLVALYNGVSQTGQAQANYVFDNIDVPSSIAMLAGHVLANDEDCCHKNYYLYRDSDHTGEWRILPWDADLSFGHTWTDPAGTPPGYSYYDPNIYATNRHSSATSLGIGGGNNFANALFNNPAIYQMYLRRVRTITDEQLQQTNTHPYILKYENMVNTLAAQIAPDAALDFAKWVAPSPNIFPPTQSLAQAVADLNVKYFPPRRRWIYTTLASPGLPTDPYTTAKPYIPPQPTNVVIQIGAIDVNPSSGNQAQEYIQFLNTNRFPVDVSDWKVSGAINHTFRRGTVIPSNSVIYLSPDVVAFRARATAPRGGMGLFVQGNYEGQLSARGELLQLVDKRGRIVQSTNYPSTQSLAQQYLRITEIMYHPAVSRPADGLDPELFEYLELKNTGPATINLVGVRLTNGVIFTFTAASAVTNLAPGESVLLVQNLAAFTARYGSGHRVAGQYTGFLDNGGENIRLDDAGGEKILDFNFNNSWYPTTDGNGFSLVIVNENMPWNSSTNLWSLKESWRPSGQPGGSPGSNDSALPTIGTVLINEALTHTDLPQVDLIELHNPSTNAVNIAGWFLTDDRLNPFKYRIPAGQIIPAGGFATFTESEFNAGGTGFALSSDGDEVYLFSGDGTNLTGFYHGFSFDGAENGVSFGRHLTSEGAEHFVAQLTVTPNAANSGPRTGPLVISEIMYHPPDLAGGDDNQDDEFVELRNLTATNVALFDAAFPTNRWHLRGGVDYDFPSSTNLAAGARLLVVSFNPTNVAKLDAFRQRYGVAPGVPVFGPYSGKLDNSADTVRLRKPDAPNLTGEVPYILVDEVEFRDEIPWTTGADGTGASLQRLALAAYGNEPTNWIAALPTAGADLSGGALPAIIIQPANALAAAYSPATFSVTASGAFPLRYQWRRNGDNITDATNATLTVNPPPYGDALYSVAVFNPGGTVVSSNALLSVVLPMVATQQPTNVLVRVRPDPAAAPTTNATFTAGVFTESPPLRFQWLRNGQAIAGQTNATLTVTGITTNDLAVFACRVTDELSSLTTTGATLYPLVSPRVLTTASGGQIRPLITVATNAPVTFGVQLQAGFPPPFTYEWRKGAGGIALGSTNVSNLGYDFYTFAATSVVATTTYRVVVKNIANAGTSGVNFDFLVVTVTDADSDGLPDVWENAYGLNPATADALADPDSDGRNNWQEYIAGTDPTNQLSCLKIDALTLTNGTRLSFQALTNHTYTIEYTDNVGAASWNKLADIPPFTTVPTNHVETVLDPAGDTNRFYRLLTPAR